MKNFGVIVVLVVAFGLGGCAGGKRFITDIKSGAEYDERKSYAANVLHATTSQELASIDSPGGGLTKPYKGVSEDKIEEALQAEAMMLDQNALASDSDKGGLDPHAEAALDVGIEAAYNSILTPGWGSASAGGLSGMQNAGITAGLLLLNGLTKNPNEGRMIDHAILYFAWVPKKEKTQEEAEQWMRDVLLQAFSNAAKSTEMQKPYALSEAQSKTFGKSVVSAYVGVSGGACDLDNIYCRFGAGMTVDVQGTEAPTFLDFGDSWLIVTSGIDEIYEGRFTEGKPENYQPPKFETLEFYGNVSRNLPGNIFMAIPGKNEYMPPQKLRGADGKIHEVTRPLLLNQGEVFLFQSPPERVAELKENAQSKKFLGLF
jgi:hypothetical protein